LAVTFAALDERIALFAPFDALHRASNGQCLDLVLRHFGHSLSVFSNRFQHALQGQALAPTERLKDAFQKSGMTAIDRRDHLLSLFRQGDDPHSSIPLAFYSCHKSTNLKPVDSDANGTGR